MATTAQEWTVTGLAVEFNMDRTALGKRLNGCKVSRAEGNRKFYMMADVLKHMFGDSVGTRSGDSKDEADRRYREAKANLAEIELAKKRGEVIEIAEVARLTRNVLNQMRTKLLALPSRLAGRLSNVTSAPKCREILKDGINEGLSELTTIDPDKDQTKENENPKEKKKRSKKQSPAKAAPAKAENQKAENATAG